MLCALSSQSRHIIIVLEAAAAAAVALVWKPCSLLRFCCLAAGAAAGLGHRPRRPPRAQHHLFAPSCNTRRCQTLLQAASCLAWASHAEAAFAEGLGTTSGCMWAEDRWTQYAYPAKCGGSSMSATRGAAGSRSAAAVVAGGCATTATCTVVGDASGRIASLPLPCLSHSSV